ncbi:MAG: ribosome maturation factor RimP [Pseudomonadota bacterium]
MRGVADRLVEAVLKPVAALGCELVGIEWQARPWGYSLLRVYIDKTEGVTVEDCARVSDQLSGILDVENPVPGRYRLEVSSPGLDRPLFELEQVTRFIGQQARLRLERKIDGQRNLVGILKGIEGNAVLLESDNQVHRVPWDTVSSARLVPIFCKD